MYTVRVMQKNTWLEKNIENAEHYQQNCRNFSSMYYTVYGLIVKTILWRFMFTILHLFIITSSGLCGGGSRRGYIGYCLIFSLTCSSIHLFDYIIRLICDCIRISIIHTKNCGTRNFLALRGTYTYIYDGSSGILDNSNVILVESTISLCGQCNSQHTCNDSDILPTSFVYCSFLFDFSIYTLL